MPLQAPSNFAPTDYSAEQSSIERQRRLAEALQAQSQTPLDTNQTAGGWVIPVSPYAGLAKMLQAYGSRKGTETADERERSLAEKYRTDLSAALVNANQAATGTPASPGSPAPADALGGGPAAPAQPAVPGSREKMIQALMQHPATQSLALQQMGNDLQRQGFMSAGGMGGSPAAPGAPSAPPATGAVPGQPAPANAPQGAPQGFGGPAGGQPMALWLQLDPSGKAYTEQLAKDWTERGKPVVNRGFGIGTMNAQGQYVPDAASLAQATEVERMKAGIGVHNVQQAGGGTVPQFGYQLPGFGGLPGSAQPQGAAPGAPQAPKITGEAPTDAAAIKAVQAASAAGQPATVRGPDPWADMPKMHIPTGIGESTYTREASTKAAEAASKIAEKYGSVAQTANERKSFNDQALQMLPQATTGTGSLAITGVQNFLTSRFGIPEEQLKKASAGDPTATLELNKNLLNAATKTAKANYGSRMTQSEVMMQIKQGSPNADMTKGAIKYLLDADNKRADYEVKQASDAGKYIQQGGDPYQFEGWYAKTFPMSKAIMGDAQSAERPAISDKTREFLRGLNIKLD